MTSLKLTKCDYGVETLGLAKKKKKKKGSWYDCCMLEMPRAQVPLASSHKEGFTQNFGG
jgi:hypothetical protein